MRVQSYNIYLVPANFFLKIFSKCAFFCNFALFFSIFDKMEVKTRAIVLQTIKYGDAQLIVDFFTEKLGRLSFMVRIPKSSKGRLKRQLFQPLMLLQLEFDYRPKSNLQRIREASIGYAFIDIPFSPYKLAISMFLAELLSYTTKNEQANASLYLFIQDSIKWLDRVEGSFSNFHIVFMIRLTFFLGFSPNIESGMNGDYFDLVDGCFVPYVPTHVHYLNREDSLRLVALLRLEYKTMHLYTMSRMERNRCVEVILEYFKLHVPGFPEMRSFSVLKELFA